MPIEAGFHYGMSAEDYFADPCAEPSLTQSIAKILIERSPAHAAAAHPRLAPKPAEDEPDRERYDAAKAIGNAAHALLIGRGKEIAEGNFPNWATKDAKAFRADHETAGRTVILSKHYEQATKIVTATRNGLRLAGCSEAFNAGKGEVVIAWEENGIWFRSMIDWLCSPTLIYDLKTTGMSVAPHVIARRAAEDGWDIQAAMQERGLDRLDPAGRGRRRFRFIAVENEEPFAMVPVELTEAWLTMGRKKLAAAIDIWRACMARGEWPAYAPEIVTPPYPGFVENRWLEREMGDVAETRERLTRPATGKPPLETILYAG